MAFGRLKVDELETSTQVISVDTLGSGVSDGNKGDITVSSGGTVWSVNDGAVALNELSDVTLSSPTDGQSLSYNASTGQWVNSTPAGGGTVTSVGLVAPTGFSVSGSPVTSSGNITLSFAAGYSLPTTASQANWDTAYSERLYWDGGATGLDAAAGRTSLGLASVASTGAYSDLTGTPSIPAAADATPQPLGAAAIGVSTDYAREDHVHAMPSAADVGADASGTAASAISTHEAAADPHPSYALESSLGGAALLDVGTTTGTVAAGDDSRFIPAGGTTGQALIKSSGTDYDASWQDITTAIDDLTDVTITSVADGEVLTYDSATGQWINATPTGGGGTPGGATGQIQWNSSGSFAGVGGSTVGASGDITLSLNGAASTPPLKLTGTWFSGGTGTTTKPQFLIEPTGTTSTAWSTSGTGLGVNAPSGFSGNLLDLQVNGASQFKVINNAIFTPHLCAAGTGAGTAVVLSPNGGANFAARLSTTTFFTTVGLGISGGAFDNSPDVSLNRDAADILAQRRGTNAQTYRLYNTYTDASNYERAYLRWASNVLEIGTEGAGTGSEKPVRITAATLNLPNLPTYADNTAATSGGLVAGDVYKTATGELRITV